MKATDLSAVLAGVPRVDLDRDDLTPADVRAAFRDLGAFDGGALTVSHWSGPSPWERHPDGDELFYVLDGEIVFTLLGDAPDERTEVRVSKGSVFVIPRNTWHRGVARDATSLTVRASEHGPVSFAEDPREDPTFEG